MQPKSKQQFSNIMNSPSSFYLHWWYRMKGYTTHKTVTKVYNVHGLMSIWPVAVQNAIVWNPNWVSNVDLLSHSDRLGKTTTLGGSRSSLVGSWGGPAVSVGTVFSTCTWSGSAVSICADSSWSATLSGTEGCACWIWGLSLSSKILWLVMT